MKFSTLLLVLLAIQLSSGAKILSVQTMRYFYIPWLDTGTMMFNLTKPWVNDAPLVAKIKIGESLTYLVCDIGFTWVAATSSQCNSTC